MYNIAYEDGRKTRIYCLHWITYYTTAEHYLRMFLLRYGDGKEDLRIFPNGKGYYNLTNARVISKEEWTRRGRR